MLDAHNRQKTGVDRISVCFCAVDFVLVCLNTQAANSLRELMEVSRYPPEWESMTREEMVSVLESQFGFQHQATIGCARLRLAQPHL